MSEQEWFVVSVSDPVVSRHINVSDDLKKDDE